MTESSAQTSSPATTRWRPILLGLLLVLLVGGGAVYYWRSRAAAPGQYFAAGQQALAEGDVRAAEQAIADLEAYPEYAPQQAFLEGSLYLLQGKLQAAYEAMQQAASAEALEDQAMTKAGQALYQAGNVNAALQIWRAVVDANPQALDAHRWLGVLYYDVGAMQNALNHLQQVSELAPDDARPNRLMGLINKDYERFDEAVRHYEESLRRDPQQLGHVEVRFELAESYIALRNYEAALQALEPCPDSPLKSVLLADCWYSTGRSEEAIGELDRVLSVVEDSLEALQLKSTIRLEQGQVEESVDLLLTAVEAHPKDYQARFQLAQALRRAGQDQEAERQAELAQQLREQWTRFSELNTRAINEPGNAAVRYEIGQLAEQLERLDLAQVWYRAALAIDPQYSDALARLQALEQPGSADGGTGNVDESGP